MGKYKNNFRLSNDGTYWIGTTSKGDIFWFSGSEKIVNYIKNNIWRKRTDGYFQNSKGERIHRIIMEVTDSKIIVDHINNEKYDNRKCNLRLSNPQDNNKNKNNKNNKFGIIGLNKINNKYYGTISLNNKNIRTKTKEKEEAIIDLLIAQRHYGFKHNDDKYYLLNGISKEREKEVIDLIETKIHKNKDCKHTKTKNIFELSDDGTYYNVYFGVKNGFNKSFKISKDDKEIIEKFYWSNYGEKYIKNGEINILLHRFILGLIEEKYSQYYIDHINGDGFDNRRENLIITDCKGNNTNIIGKGYYMYRGKFRASISDNGKRYSKIFNTKEEAIKWYKNKKEELLSKRNKWDNKEELDKYIENNLKE